MSVPVGLVVASTAAPEKIADTARLAEDLGFAELWIPEDYWCLGSVACLVRALSVTERIPVGVGVMSSLVRHPAVAAMEIASAERMFPGRVLPGLGLGLPPLMDQMGLRPRSQLGALREGVEIVRTLLSGAEVATDGDVFAAKGIKLAHPPDAVPPIYTGVLGPKMLRLSGRVADGTVVSAMASPAYLRWVRQCVDEGVAERTDGVTAHRLPTFAMYAVDNDTETARAAVRPVVALYLSLLVTSPLVTRNAFAAEVADMHARGGADAAELLAREMPDEWLDELTVSGDPKTCAAAIERLHAAGADSVILMPVASDDVEQTIRRTAAEVLPLLDGVGA